MELRSLKKIKNIWFSGLFFFSNAFAMQQEFPRSACLDPNSKCAMKFNMEKDLAYIERNLIKEVIPVRFDTLADLFSEELITKFGTLKKIVSFSYQNSADDGEAFYYRVYYNTFEFGPEIIFQIGVKLFHSNYHERILSCTGNVEVIQDQKKDPIYLYIPLFPVLKDISQKVNQWFNDKFFFQAILGRIEVRLQQLSKLINDPAQKCLVQNLEWL